MSILDIFKKTPSKQNTSKNNLQPQFVHRIYNNGILHAYAFSPEDSTIFMEYENGEVVSRLHFSVSKNELKICDFLAGGIDKDYHHGTELLLTLLIQLQTPFTKIHGVLSPIDADNMNWTRSIPFYMDLPPYIFSRLGRRYQFFLFDDEHYEHDVTDILSSESERSSNIENYRLNHLYDENGNIKKRFGSFHYILM